MKIQYTTLERLHGLFMLSLSICGLFVLANVGDFFYSDRIIFFDTIERSSVVLFLFFPIFAVCLSVGMPTWWIGQRLGYSSYLAAFVSGALVISLLILIQTWADSMVFISVWRVSDIIWAGVYILLGGLCGITARYFAERARQKNIDSL